MSTVEASIDVEMPLSTVYNQWTQFEEFPEFMESVESVQQLDDTRLHWTASIAGVDREWDAVISEQHPDERIAWTSTSGARNAGVVTFHHIDDHVTRVMLQLDFEPDGMVDAVGDKLGFVRRRAEADLERFKSFIEGRGRETGEWRGDVERPVSG